MPPLAVAGVLAEVHAGDTIKELVQKNRDRLGSNSPPLRTIQRRIQKLAREGAFSKRSARKNASYAVPAAEGRSLATSSRDSGP